MSRSQFSRVLTLALLLLSMAAAAFAGPAASAASGGDEAPPAAATREACPAPDSPSVPALRFLTEPPLARVMPAGTVTPSCGNCPACFGDLVYCRIDCRETYLPDEAAVAACIQVCVNLYCGCTAYACPGSPPV